MPKFVVEIKKVIIREIEVSADYMFQAEAEAMREAGAEAVPQAWEQVDCCVSSTRPVNA